MRSFSLAYLPKVGLVLVNAAGSSHRSLSLTGLLRRLKSAGTNTVSPQWNARNIQEQLTRTIYGSWLSSVRAGTTVGRCFLKQSAATYGRFITVWKA